MYKPDLNDNNRIQEKFIHLVKSYSEKNNSQHVNFNNKIYSNTLQKNENDINFLQKKPILGSQGFNSVNKNSRKEMNVSYNSTNNKSRQRFLIKNENLNNSENNNYMNYIGKNEINDQNNFGGQSFYAYQKN